LAFAGPVSFSNIPIINNAGQPVVQIVVGSTAQPSDGVVAANIAAVIGNLAYTSTPVTATVGNTGAVTCAVTTPSCTLSNQQVYLGEKGIVTATGSYTIRALIGSVLNAGALNYNNLNYTKSLTSNKQYAYGEQSSPYPITSSNPLPYSVFQGIGISVPTSVVASTNGGGLTFSSFQSTSSGTTYDNIIELTNAQVPGLMSASGPYSASESLWLYGFPVYDQATNNFELLDAGGAYELTFGKPIQFFTSSGSPNYATFSLLGENWTIYNITNPNTVPISGLTSNTYALGSSTKLQLAKSMTPLETVYVGHNITSGPFTVVLQDLSYPNSNGISDAAIAVYKNGAGPYNETAIAPDTTATLNVTGTPLYVHVGTTFPGLYAYQKWAQIQLFSNIFNITSGKVFNNEPGWYAEPLFTTNQSTSTSITAHDIALYGIVLYSNQSATTNLAPGSSFDYITNPAVWKATFVGDSLGAPGSGNSNYDALSFSTSSQVLTYENPASSKIVSPPDNGFYWSSSSSNELYANPTPLPSINVTSITEPTNLFTVTSQIPTAFQITAISGPSPTSSVSSVQYNLDTYSLTAVNAVNTLAMPTNSFPSEGMYFTVSNGIGLSGNYITTTNPLTVYITGYKTGSSTPTTFTITFNSLNSNTVYPELLGNITNIKLGYAFPAPGVTVTAYATANTNWGFAIGNTVEANDIELASLTYSGPTLAYTVPQYSYYMAPNALTSNVMYTGESNYNVPFTLAPIAPTPAPHAATPYFSYTMPEITAPATGTPNANVIMYLTNSSTLLSNPLYWLNITNGNNNALTYVSSQGNSVKAPQGFRTERGSEVASISTTSVTYDMAKSLDTLQFLVGPASSTVSSATKTYGPFGIGQATNIPNVTIANVTATCTFSSTSCSVKGLSNLTATPSVTSAITPVHINTASTPLAVLDTNANPASTLIV
ncbi:MAG: S-layer protein, partial [Candidatus Micrarchaeaceae archaeon]